MSTMIVRRQTEPKDAEDNTPMDEPTDPAAMGVEQAFTGAYQELRRLARSRLRGGGRNTVLDTTVLVHETYLKLSRTVGVSFPDRPRFLVYAGRAMRSIAGSAFSVKRPLRARPAGQPAVARYAAAWPSRSLPGEPTAPGW
jgi:DNA-directed RNA polymerase specialized sigma24 family protein